MGSMLTLIGFRGPGAQPPISILLSMHSHCCSVILFVFMCFCLKACKRPPSLRDETSTMQTRVHPQGKAHVAMNGQGGGYQTLCKSSVTNGILHVFFYTIRNIKCSPGEILKMLQFINCTWHTLNTIWIYCFIHSVGPGAVGS